MRSPIVWYVCTYIYRYIHVATFVLRPYSSPVSDPSGVFQTRPDPNIFYEACTQFFQTPFLDTFIFSLQKEFERRMTMQQTVDLLAESPSDFSGSPMVYRPSSPADGLSEEENEKLAASLATGLDAPARQSRTAKEAWNNLRVAARKAGAYTKDGARKAGEYTMEGARRAGELTKEGARKVKNGKRTNAVANQAARGAVIGGAVTAVCSGNPRAIARGATSGAMWFGAIEGTRGWKPFGK